mmetsp:Transcript_35760/g.78347  ORF Transcript_35760/g.78347 Transcript_35760/m.78347 type:complete len:361 (+) Transcript_35760:98-1180(+)
MGGDGGTVSTNRLYLRGAGRATHTADAQRQSTTSTTEDERERLRQVMTTCSVTGQPLDLSSRDIVACPYGRLYNREAAVQALLRRKETQAAASAAGAGSNNNGGGSKGPEPDMGWHVRGLKDLHPVRFQVAEKDEKVDSNGNGTKSADRFVAVCPLTGVELNGATPAYLIVRSKKSKKDDTPCAAAGAAAAAGADDESPNVLSERAIREVGAESLQEEYGPFDEEMCIRLAPTTAGGVMEKIKADLELRRAEEKKAKKKSKKRKDKDRTKPADDRGDSADTKDVATNTSTSKKSKQRHSSTGTIGHIGVGGGSMSVADAARSSVATAVASNAALSSLFASTSKSDVTDKEKRDALFTQNC